MTDYDLFISHASEDKESLVRPLAVSLEESGLNVWYDEFTLNPGDSLRESIDKGLANSNYAVLVLSEEFFAKKWTNWELNGLVQRHLDADYPLIMPLWHEINASEVKRYSPPLADIVAISSSIGVPKIAAKVLRTIQNNKFKYSDAPIIDNVITEETKNILRDAMKKTTALARQLCNRELPRTGLLVPNVVDGMLVLSELDTDDIGSSSGYIPSVIPAKNTLVGIALSQDSYVDSESTQWDRCWGTSISQEYYKGTLALPIIVNANSNSKRVVGVLLFDSKEALNLSEEVLNQIQQIVSLGFGPLFESLIMSGEITLTSQ